MNTKNLIAGFQNADESQCAFLIKFLEDVGQLPLVLECFNLQLALLKLKKEYHVLDIGCGIGIQVQAMAEIVGTAGKVTGTDISSTMIEIAKSRLAASNLSVEFFVSDALKQPFASHSFDCIRAERVLMYIKNIEAVFTEIKRLLKPGGKFIVFDFEWDALVIAHPDKTLTRKIVRYISDSFPSGHIGSELHRRFKQTGFKNIKVQPFSYSGETDIGNIGLELTKKICEGALQTGVVNNVFTQKEIADWWQILEADAKRGDFFASYQGFIAVGTA
jgi:ubiquinone/menaquinone biosynthesis C-methylase UbiE